jgi:CheY-like chemotaxis protein
MARIACFADSATLFGCVQHGLSGSDHELFHHSSSRLSIEIRQSIRQLAPDLILMELTPRLDNPHLYFFLRSDAVTRHIPVIMMSSSSHVALHAVALGADGFLHAPFSGEQIGQVLDRLLPLPLRARAAGELLAEPALLPVEGLGMRLSAVA